MKKKIGVIVLGLMVLFATNLMAGGGQQQQASGGAAKKWRIAFLAKGNMDVFVKNISDAALKRGQELSDKCTVTVFDAEG
jgi:ABC-type sugar transport system substrate-binding protein